MAGSACLYFSEALIQTFQEKGRDKVSTSVHYNFIFLLRKDYLYRRIIYYVYICVYKVVCIYVH